LEDYSEDSDLQRNPPAYVDADASLNFLEESTEASSSSQQEPGASLTCKLKSLCLPLFNSLTFEEKEALNNSAGYNLLLEAKDFISKPVAGPS
jgi:hypothetical protein